MKLLSFVADGNALFSALNGENIVTVNALNSKSRSAK